MKLILNTKNALFCDLTEHMLMDSKPSTYINFISKGRDFKEYPFIMLLKLKATEQSAKYHPEGSVWNHTMLVVDEAAKVREESSDESAFMWAALLHDIGKPDTTRNKKGRITSYDHDMVGSRLAVEFMMALTDDSSLINHVKALVRYHMHMLYILKGLPYGDPGKLVRDTDIHDLALLCRCDRLGRGVVNIQEEEMNYKMFIKKLQELQSL